MIGALRDRFQMRKKKPADDGGAAELDWNLRTGGHGSVVGFPAKYSFDISASNCTDVIDYTVDQAGTSSRVNVIAITNPYAGCPGNLLGQTPTVKFGLRMASVTARTVEAAGDLCQHTLLSSHDRLIHISATPIAAASTMCPPSHRSSA
jgi:hypothetical protein